MAISNHFFERLLSICGTPEDRDLMVEALDSGGGGSFDPAAIDTDLVFIDNNEIKTQDETDTDSKNLVIATGDITDTSDNFFSGDLTVSSGDNTSTSGGAQSGHVRIVSGNTEQGPSGRVSIITGNSNNSDSGDIILFTGGSGGSRGDVIIDAALLDLGSTPMLYEPGVSADWPVVPTTLQQALDYLAARVKALEP